MLALDHIRVHDAMHQGILSCEADTPLGQLAEIMARNRVHAVAIAGEEASHPAGVVTALDLVAAIASGQELTAAQAAANEPLTISSDERLDRAAELMAERGAAHLVVLDAAHGHPVGILSTLDIAAVCADGGAPRRGSEQ